MQQRLTLFSKLMFWVLAALMIFVLGLYEIYPETRPRRVAAVHGFVAVGLAVLGAIWYFGLHRRRLSVETLYRLDLLYLLYVGIGFGLSSYLSSEQRAAVYAAFIFHTFSVFSRVIVIPSSARRTAVVSALSFLPLQLAGIGMAIDVPDLLELPPAALVVGNLVFSAVAVVLATTGSRVIYGLRRQVSEARQLGQYTLDEKIGEGGMGAVYRARHAMLRRATAIKLLLPDKSGIDNLKRFEREVHHMSRLTHPNTVAVFDYGRSPEGVFYYAMEYLDGIDLETLVRRDGPQPAPRVIHILRQICGALDEAHAMGLTHRDVKPANVILCQRGRKPDVVKVVDYGLVQELTRGDDDGAAAARGIAGTPAYLAPEAVTEPDTVGPHSDLYSLGAVGYYLLTGCRLFDGKTAVEICVHHVSTPPTPPSQRTDNPIPADLEALVLACLSKAPSERPVSAHAMRLALSRMPAYRDYDEAAALAWWRELDARRARDRTTDPDPQPLTITVDVRGRTEDLGE
jgi:eukaryotic-like serine/threonine-protein kinase